MPTPNNAADQIKKSLNKFAKKVTINELAKWKSNTWAHTIAILAGLDPFKEPTTTIIPKSFHAFLPKVEFSPKKIDRYNAYMTLRNAMDCVNDAIVEATKEVCKNMAGEGGVLSTVVSNLSENIESFRGKLLEQLNDFNNRKQFFQYGAEMMSPEEAWTGKHHLFALMVLETYEDDQERILTADEFLGIAEDIGILVDGKTSFDPFT
jgi:hypothetical protein